MSIKTIAYSSLALLVAATTACTPASPPQNTTVSAKADVFLAGCVAWCKWSKADGLV